MQCWLNHTVFKQDINISLFYTGTSLALYYFSHWNTVQDINVSDQPKYMNRVKRSFNKNVKKKKEKYICRTTEIFHKELQSNEKDCSMLLIIIL